VEQNKVEEDYKEEGKSTKCGTRSLRVDDDS